MKRNLIIGGVALVLLLISIKFFPYHCNCQARTDGMATTPSSGAASSTASSTSLMPAGTRTAEVDLDAPDVVIDGRMLSVDVADTEQKREQGLSGRASLCADCAMLFIFPGAQKPGFWMKDMNFSIDIVWIGPDKKIVGVEKNLSPATYPKIFYPPAPVEYVLEMPAGQFDKHGFKIGDAATINL